MSEWLAWSGGRELRDTEKEMLVIIRFRNGLYGARGDARPAGYWAKWKWETPDSQYDWDIVEYRKVDA